MTLKADPAALPPVLAQPGDPARATQMRGIVLLLLAIVLFTLMDATGKYLSARYHPVQVVWARFITNLVIVMVIFAPRLRSTFASSRPVVQFFRGVTQFGSILLFFCALQFIGLAEATAIMDINPVLITLGAAIFLGESIGIRRLLGILTALCGAMIIIRPGAGVFHPAALFALVAAFTYAAGAILTRIARTDRHRPRSFGQRWWARSLRRSRCPSSGSRSQWATCGLFCCSDALAPRHKPC
ncbi:DMT family transporter [Paracoccus kondratievae]